jgi:hypothetical protein
VHSGEFGRSVLRLFGSPKEPNNRMTWMTQITKYSVIRVTQITKFGDSFFFVFIWMINRKIHKGGAYMRSPSIRWPMLHHDANNSPLATLSVPTPVVLLYIDSVMIKYMKELHYQVWCIQQSIMCKIRLFVVNRHGSNEKSAHSIYGAQILSFGQFFSSDN